MKKRRHAGRCVAAVIAFAGLLPGCVTTFGSGTIGAARLDYNEAIFRSWNEQMLLNLVRLRYRDTPEFLEVTSVLTQYAYEGSIGGGTVLDLDAGSTGFADAGADLNYSERPTITYVPLQGKDFAQQFLAPISPATIVMLSQSGWSSERLMLTCVHQINDVKNVPAAAGPMPDYVPMDLGFLELARLFRRLQVASMTEVGRRTLEEGREVLLVRFRRGEGDLEGDRVRLYEILGLDPEVSEFELTAASFDRGPGQLSMIGRSLMGTMFFLSHAVEVPEEDEANGKVTITRYPNGDRFEWSPLSGAAIRVRSSAERPGDAFVRVRYRGHWFYIEDNDLNSKTTFGLLKYLFLLQSTPSGKSPLITVSAGS